MAQGQWAEEGILRSPTSGEVTSRRAFSKRTRREAPSAGRHQALGVREPGCPTRGSQAQSHDLATQPRSSTETAEPQ